MYIAPEGPASAGRCQRRDRRRSQFHALRLSPSISRNLNMRAYQGVAAGFTLLGLLAMSATSAPPDAPVAPSRIESGTVAVRLLLGEGDESPRSWDGKASIDRGEVLRDRRISIPRGRSRSRAGLMESQESYRSQNSRQGESCRSAKKSAGPAPYGGTTAPNGIVVTLKAPEDATLSISTEHGHFAVKLADLAAVRRMRISTGKRSPSACRAAGRRRRPAAAGFSRGRRGRARGALDHLYRAFSAWTGTLRGVDEGSPRLRRLQAIRGRRSS